MELYSPAYSRINSALLLSALLLLFVILNISSNGTARQVGEDEADSSTIGNAGRQAVPAEADGIGDSTGPRPFLGFSKDQELMILHNPSAAVNPLAADVVIPRDAMQPGLDGPLPRLVNIVREQDITTDSSALNITEVIQRAVDVNVLSASAVADAPGDEATPVAAADSASQQGTTDDPVAELAAAPIEQAASDQNLTSISWTNLTALLEQVSYQDQSATAAVNPETGTGGSNSQADKQQAVAPEGVFRPLLPPLQRVRPLQRSGLLPPPVRPLRP